MRTSITTYAGGAVFFAIPEQCHVFVTVVLRDVREIWIDFRYDSIQFNECYSIWILQNDSLCAGDVYLHLKLEVCFYRLRSTLVAVVFDEGCNTSKTT